MSDGETRSATAKGDRGAEPDPDVGAKEPRTGLALAEAVQSAPPSWPQELTPRAFGDACREAGLAFLDGVAAGWSKRDLAAWLAGPYAALTARGEADDESPPSSERSVAEETLGALMQDARDAVTATLMTLAAGDWDAVTSAIQEAHLAPLRAAGELVWVPRDRRRMRLAARVLSLFLADYLVDAEPYEAVARCSHCDAIRFAGPCPFCDEEPMASYTRELASLHHDRAAGDE